MKVGLLLEGGAMRGMYTAGVLDVLLENNIKVDLIIGVSAGALFGVNYKSRQKGRAYRFNSRYIHDKRYFGMYSLVTTGNILNQDFCFKDIPEVLDDFNYGSFKRTKEEFYAVVTNMKTGKAEYKKIEDVKKDIESLRASGSMPFVSKPVEINGELYLDGGIADGIPIQKMVSMGVDKIIAVLTRPEEYRKKKMNLTLAKVMYKDYPNLIETMKNRHKVYNKSIEEVNFLNEENEAFLIRPSRYIKMKRVEKDEKVLAQMYNLGVSDMQEKIEDLKKYLKEKND